MIDVDRLSRAEAEALAYQLIQQRDARREAQRGVGGQLLTRKPLRCVYEGPIVTQWRSNCQNNVAAFSTRMCDHPDFPGLCRRQKARTIDAGFVATCSGCNLRETAG